MMEVIMTLDPPRGGPQSTLARLIEDYNPFYLLSAACMLFGVFALNDSLDWSPIPLRKLLTLIVTLNVYEIAVIFLGCFLMRRGIRRDALLLFIVEAFFLADVGFLNMEVFATSARIGVVVNAAILVLAVLKVALIFTAARIPLIDPRFAFVTIQLAVLFAISGIFGIIGERRDTFLPPLAIYAAWWLAGALPVAYTVTIGSVDLFRKAPDDAPASAGVILSRVLVVLPMLSLIAHLCLANWVYKVMFHPANFAPLLLGFAILAGHADTHVATLGRRMRLQLALPFVAVAFSAIKFPPALVFPLGMFDCSPLRMASTVAAIVYMDGLWQFRHAYFAWAGGMCAMIAALGHSVATVHDNSLRLAKEGGSALDALMPKTLSQWGMVSIAASFVLLAIGAIISLTRRPREVEIIVPLEDA
jgi:hypothetical protein